MKTNSLLITFEDLVGIAKRNKKFLIKIGIAAVIFAVGFCCTRPIRYKAEASFLDGGVQGSTNPFASVLSSLSSSSQGGGALFMMQSQKVLRRVVEDMGLQAEIRGYPSKGRKRNILDNLQYAIYKKVDKLPTFTFSNVHYDQKKAKELILCFQNTESFSVRDKAGTLLAQGRVGEGVYGGDFEWTLKAVPKNLEINRDYFLTISPWVSKVSEIGQHLEIRPDKKDKQVLWLYYAHRDSKLAARLVNQVVASFIQNLREDNEQVAEMQLAFLDERRNKLEEEFDQALNTHVNFLKANIVDSGFVEVKQQIEVTAKSQGELREKIVGLESLEGSLKDVQATYAKAVGVPFLLKDELLAENSDTFSGYGLVEKNRFWPEQFAGVDLDTAKRLHEGYQRDLDGIEGQIDKIEFILPKLRVEGFEVNALSGMAGDSVTAALAQTASGCALSLRDKGNHSQKEIYRLEENLKSQKKFIEAHFQQTLELHKRQARTLESKLAALRAVMLKLIDKEKNVTNQQLKGFQDQLGHVPERWQNEKKLESRSEMMQKVAEGMTQMIEGKVIEHYLKNINSKLIDPARAPGLLLRANPIKYMILFAFLGLAGGYFFLLARTIWKGFPLSVSTAVAYGLQVCGPLSMFRGANFEEIPTRDLQTLRKAISYLENNRKILEGTIFAVVGQNQRGVALNLASLISWQNKRILVVDLSFSGRIQPNTVSGIYQYLQGKVDSWEVMQKEMYDLLPSGGASRFSTELLRTERFDNFVNEVREKYEKILFICEASLDATEVQLVMNKADLSFVAVGEESYEFLTGQGITETKKTAYLFQET